MADYALENLEQMQICPQNKFLFSSGRKGCNYVHVGCIYP